MTFFKSKLKAVSHKKNWKNFRRWRSLGRYLRCLCNKNNEFLKTKDIIVFS